VVPPEPQSGAFQRGAHNLLLLVPPKSQDGVVPTLADVVAGASAGEDVKPDISAQPPTETTLTTSTLAAHTAASDIPPPLHTPYTLGLAGGRPGSDKKEGGSNQPESNNGDLSGSDDFDSDDDGEGNGGIPHGMGRANAKALNEALKDENGQPKVSCWYCFSSRCFQQGSVYRIHRVWLQVVTGLCKDGVG